MGDSTDETIDVAIWNEARTKTVTTTTDGATERLDVDATIVGGSFQLQEFVPVVVIDPTGVSLSTGAWNTLLNVTSTQGKLDFIGCAGGSSNYRVRVTMDSLLIFNVSMADLNSIGLSNDVNVPMRAETALKNFRYRPLEGVDFTTSILIEAQATSATPTLTSLISYRKVP